MKTFVLTYNCVFTVTKTLFKQDKHVSVGSLEPVIILNFLTRI